ncbi:hypothetical protein F183_A22650 [Bryobacterales bacterium F-183]|nr:hypothetical protein F183_A22650 [Bryobacterales bacterium F-183]
MNLRPAITTILFHCIAVSVASGQALVLPGDPNFARVEEFFRQQFEPGATAPQNKLKCSLQQIPPRVTFNFRFFTGFFVSLPVQQFVGRDKNSIAMVMRATPDTPGQQPAYFVYRNDLPELPKDVGRARFEFSGGFYTGLGKYRVEIALRDSADRTCTAAWTSTARDRKVPIQLADGQIAPLGYDRWTGMKNTTDGGRVTVFVHAIPLYYRRALSKLGAFDRTTLLTSLTSLLDQSKFSSARVVVFDLLGKRVLFKQDGFDRRGYRRLIDVLERTNYGTVDVKTLQQGGNDSTFIRNLLRDEMKETQQSEAIVFLGAEGRPAPKALPDLKEYNLPAMFYMGFTRFQVPIEDAMYQAVRSTKGKTITVFRPVDLANGIRSLVQTTSGNSGGAP